MSANVQDHLNGAEAGTSDAFGSFDHPLQCFLVRDRAVAIPYGDAGSEEALDGAAVESDNTDGPSSAWPDPDHRGSP